MTRELKSKSYMKMAFDRSYLRFITELKQSIIRSRFHAASLANREQLLLYLYIGQKLSEKTQSEKWGSKIIEQISKDLQKELPGLRGFSYRSLMNMRQFADEYYSAIFLQSSTAEFVENAWPLGTDRKNKKLQLPTAELEKDGILRLTKEQLDAFFKVSFTHHIALIQKCKSASERFFYMGAAAYEMWSVDRLESQIDSGLYKTRGKLPNNFAAVLTKELRSTALNVFKDEYLFDFVNPDSVEDERVFEDAMVANIRKTMMSLGKGFTFIGNQYRLEVEGQEYFVDLLFYNRILRCLVAFELKRGKFKPEYAGQLNFYLSVLDDQARQPHENPSIGIILCKEKNNTIVEYAFRGMNKAMGVATYKLTKKLPAKLRGILPDAEELKRLL